MEYLLRYYYLHTIDKQIKVQIKMEYIRAYIGLGIFMNMSKQGTFFLSKFTVEQQLCNAKTLF